MKKSINLIVAILTMVFITVNISPNVVQAVTLPLKYSIDFVRFNKTTQSVEIQGWALSGNNIKSVTATINGTDYPLDIMARDDVDKAFPEYYDANCGFSKIIALETTPKSLNVDIKITEDNGDVTTKNYIAIKPLPLKYFIDFVRFNKTTQSVEVQGWALSGNNIKSVTATINGIDYPLDIIARDDVDKAFPEYTNANCGFGKTIVLGTTPKTLKVDIKITEDNGKMTTRSYTVIKPLPLKYSVDFVRFNIITQSIEVQGWAVSGNNIKSVTALVNGKSYELNTTKRNDVT